MVARYHALTGASTVLAPGKPRAGLAKEGVLSRSVLMLAATLLLVSCGSLRAPPPQFPQSQSPGGQSAVPPSGSAGSSAPAGPARPAPRQFHLGPAASSLVAQAHKQIDGGDFGLAAATIERAMRIEPDSPLLWIELGRVRYTSGDVKQAESMGRKALALATGDPRAQASAWKLIADSLRSQRRNAEAAEADKHAAALSER